MGISERVRDAPGHGTLFNSLLYFAEDGRLVNHYRKLIPTYSKLMVWGHGDAAGLRIAKVHNVFGGCDLLGTLDAPDTAASTQRWRTDPYCRVAYGARDASDCEQALRFRRMVLCARGGADNESQ